MTSARLRRMLGDPAGMFLLGAHDALSAVLAEEAGAPGIWASSLGMSCVRGLRDNSELTMTEALDTLEAMTARVTIPILFDGDTGYGDFSHFRQLVRRLHTRRVAGVAIEDKRFPKANSLLDANRHALVSVEEFCGKLRAGRDVRQDADFVLVARTEALIAGLGMREAVARAERYAEAGADAILIHSKALDFGEVREFLQRFSRRVPVVCVPTTYYSTANEVFAEARVLPIWANHLLRAAARAMADVAARIAASGSARDVEESIASIAELFRLQDTAVLSELERHYAPRAAPRAVVLAASRGHGLDALTVDRPKCMISVGGVPVLDRLIRHLRAESVRDISVVRGYRAEAVAPAGVRAITNERWERTGPLHSLELAEAALADDVVVLYGDLLFKRYVLHELLASAAELTIVVDGSRDCVASGRPADRVRVSARPKPGYDEGEYSLRAISTEIPDAECDGEWIGLLRARGAGVGRLHTALRRVLAEPGGEAGDLDTLLQDLVDGGNVVRVLYINRDWSDVDELSDVVRASGS